MSDMLNITELFPETKKPLTVVSPEEELNVDEVVVKVEIKFDPITSKGDKQDFIDDINYVRTKLLCSIGKADKILENLLGMISMDEKLIEMSQPPKGYYRYYDVSTSLLKSITDASKELINLHASNAKIKKEMEWGEIKAKEEQKENEIKEKKVNKTSSLKDLVQNFKNMKAETEGIK